MKRAVILVLLCITFATFVLAEQGVYRDRFGNTTGSYQDSGNQRTYRDSHGNTTGTSRHDGNSRSYYDRHGNYQGSRDRDRRDR
jgi:hypothetical protein